MGLCLCAEVKRGSRDSKMDLNTWMIQLQWFMFRKPLGFKRCWWRTGVEQTNSNKLVKPWCTTWSSPLCFSNPTHSARNKRHLSLHRFSKWACLLKGRKNCFGCALPKRSCEAVLLWCQISKRWCFFYLFISVLAFLQISGLLWLKGLSWKRV